MSIHRMTHSTIRRVMLAGLTLAATAMPSVARAQERPLAALGFMAGCWRGDVGANLKIEEQWTAADSDVMLATTRYLDASTGRTRDWEFSRIVADSAGITLLPAPRGTQQGRFRMAPGSADEARFEDPAHDFPKRIIYRLDGPTLVVRVDGGEGASAGMELRMQRVACPAAAAP